VSGIETYETSADPEFIKECRWNMEINHANICYNEEKFGPAAQLSIFLKKLDIGNFNLYKCNCINPDTLSDAEILKIAGF